MQLQEWLKTKGITPAEFARRIGAARSTVHRYLQPPGDEAARLPTREVMKKITRATGGKVRPDDFYTGLYRPRRKRRKP